MKVRYPLLNFEHGLELAAASHQAVSSVGEPICPQATQVLTAPAVCMQGCVCS